MPVKNGLLFTARKRSLRRLFSQVSVCPRGGRAWWWGCAWQGACVAVGGVRGWGDVWQEGAYVAGEMATAVGGAHPTGMHSCFKIFLGGHMSFYGATDTLVSDFCYVFSGFQSQGGQPYSHLVEAYVMYMDYWIKWLKPRTASCTGLSSGFVDIGLSLRIT